MTLTELTANLEVLAQKSTSLATLDSNFLQHILCIYYLIQFPKGYSKALINFGNKVNAMTAAFAITFGFTTRKTNVETRKIDGSHLKTYAIVLAKFFLQKNVRKV